MVTCLDCGGECTYLETLTQAKINSTCPADKAWPADTTKTVVCSGVYPAPAGCQGYKDDPKNGKYYYCCP